jgi:hypothetical protein
VYRVGTGDWSATQWSLSSGGSLNANNFPLPQDTAIFDTNTVTGTHTIDRPWWIGNLDTSALNVAVTLANGTQAPIIYGNVTLDTDVTLTGTGAWNFSGASNQTITSAGVAFTQPLTINKPAGTSFVLGDAITTSGTFTLTQGTLDLNTDKTLTCSTFSSSNTNTRSIAFGTSGKIVVTGNNLAVWNTLTEDNLTVSGNSIVELNYSGSTGTRTISDGSGIIIYKVTAGSDIFRLSSGSDGLYKTIDFTGFSGALTTTSTVASININGDLIFSPTMTVTAQNGSITLLATTGTQQITTNGITLDFPITKNAAGTLQLIDNLTMGSTRTFTHTAGTLDVNDKTLTTGLYSSTGSTARQLDVGTGTLAVTGATFTASGSNYTTAGSGLVSMTSSSAKTFAGGGFTYPTLNQGGAGTLTITGANTFANITNTVQPTTIRFTSGTTNSFSDFNVNGTLGNLVTINSTTPGVRATLVKI